MPDRSTPTTPGTLVTTAVLLLSAMTVMANATISPSLPGLREHYAATPGIETLTGLTVTLPSLAIVLTAGLIGWLADRSDRRRLLLVFGLLYAVGGTSGLWVDGLTGLLIGRLVLGVGVAGTMVLATTWAADLWQGDARAQFLGRQGAANSGGGVVVILVGGALAALHWRGAFATYLLVVPVTLLAFRALAPYERQRLATPGVLVEAEAPAGGFPWRVFAFVGPCAFLFMAVFYVIPTQLPFALRALGVSSPLLIGAVTSLVTLAALPGALNYGRLRRNLAAMTIFALSWGVMGAGLLIIGTASSVVVTALGVAVVGIGMGPAIPNFTAYLMAVVPTASRGRASGLLTTALFAGQFASPLVSAPLASAFSLPGAFQALGAAQLVLASTAAVVSLRQKRRPAAASR